MSRRFGRPGRRVISETLEPPAESTMSKVVFESPEEIYGRLTRGREIVTYRGLLRVRDSGKKPVSLELTFVPPHPFCMDMPTEKCVRAESITEAYAKLARFFAKMGVEFCP